MGAVVQFKQPRVIPKAKMPDHPRPYQTHYYGSPLSKITDWSRISRASTPVGAIRAATVRIVMGQYRKAIVHGLDGEVLFTITRKGREIKIFGRFMIPEN